MAHHALKINPDENNFPEKRGADRRKTQRFDTALDVSIRFSPDGSPLKGSGVDVGPNGMRVITTIPLAEASYVHISFDSSSNSTHCEGRVVWTQRLRADAYESGVDIQRWGGEVPGEKIVNALPDVKPKKDRRNSPR
jgi:hypothetical protein